MNQIQFDPNGGDLGRAVNGYIEPLELSVVLPHVAHILECLHQHNNSNKPYFYAFEFSSHARKGIELVMENTKLPEHVGWYTTDGMKMFAIRGASGGVVSSMICYLVTKR